MQIISKFITILGGQVMQVFSNSTDLKRIHLNTKRTSLMSIGNIDTKNSYIFR